MTNILVLVFQLVVIRKPTIGKLFHNYNHSFLCILGRG